MNLKNWFTRLACKQRVRAEPSDNLSAPADTEREEMDEQEKDLLHDYWRITLGSKKEQHQSVSKAILTLAAGAFALSLSFYMQKQVEPGTEWQLITAWVCFAISVASTLVSFRTSAAAAETLVRDVQDALLSGKKDAITKGESRQNKATRRLNDISLFTFVLGLGFLLTFGVTNIL
jgi:hypothetical protein